MLTRNCPSCGGEIKFKSSITLYAVCEYCTSLVVRQDLDVKSLGKVAHVPDDVSPLQLGTTGVYQSANFEIIGRLKVRWEKGIWNEWFLFFDNGEEGWLAEAQGFWMVSFEEPYTVSAPAVGELSPGAMIKVAIDTQNLRDTRRLDARFRPSLDHTEKIYFVDDIKNIVCMGSEGELPFAAQPGRESVSVDVSAAGGAFATLEYSKDEGLRYFAGKYVDFDAFRFANLRELEGWAR